MTDVPQPDDSDDPRIDCELYSLCVQGWQLHRELAVMQAALKLLNPHRAVLPAGLCGRPVVRRDLAAPCTPSGTWHQLLVAPEYAFKCSGAERVEQLEYGELQQGLQRQLRKSTEDTLKLQKSAKKYSQSTTAPHCVDAVPSQLRCLMSTWCASRTGELLSHPPNAQQERKWMRTIHSTEPSQ